MNTILALVLLASYAPPSSPPPPTAPTQPSEARPQKKCDNHSIAWTGCKEGHALYYTESAWRRVLNVRIRQGRITVQQANSSKNFTAHTDCSLIGKYAYISLNGGPIERYLIADCSQPYHVRWHVEEHRVAEVNYNAFIRNGCRGGRCNARLVNVRSR